MIYGKPLPLAAGKYYWDGSWIDPSDPIINGGGIQNHGYEFTVGYQDTKGDFSYGINGYLSIDRNKVLDLDGRILDEQGLKVGEPIYSFYGYTSNGIVKNQAILDAHPYLTNPANDFPIGLGDIWTVVGYNETDGKRWQNHCSMTVHLLERNTPISLMGCREMSPLKDGPFRL